MSLKDKIDRLEAQVEKLKIDTIRLENTISMKDELIGQMLDGLKIWNNLMTHEEYDSKWPSNQTPSHQPGGTTCQTSATSHVNAIPA